MHVILSARLQGVYHITCIHQKKTF